MPRREALSAVQKAALTAPSTAPEDLVQHYTLSESELALIRLRRGDHNRLGFAVQLCYLRYPGIQLGSDVQPPEGVLKYIGKQLHIKPTVWAEYAARDETRREHALELQQTFGYRSFTRGDYRAFKAWLTDLALQTHSALSLAQQLVDELRARSILLPPPGVIDQLCVEALARGTRLFYQHLTEELDDEHRARLDAVLDPREQSRIVVLTWLRQPPGEAKAAKILQHLDRFEAIRALALPADLGRSVHQNRLAQLAREGAQMNIRHLRDLESTRRYATLVSLLLDTQATVIDQILDMHDRFMGRLFSSAKRKHAEAFQQQAKAINQKIRQYAKVGHALIDARKTKADPYEAIETILSWEDFTKSVAEVDELMRPESFDHLPRIVDAFPQLRRYAPRLLEALAFKAAPVAQPVLDAIEAIRALNSSGGKTLAKDAPTDFVKPRWKEHVMKDDGLERRFYELCAMAELKNTLRSGDMWVPGSRQFKDFEDYLLPPARFAAQHEAGELPLSIDTDGERYLQERLALLKSRLQELNRLAASGLLPEAEIADELLKIKPLVKTVPEEAEQLEEDLFDFIPPVKITELLMEVDRWTGFTQHFTHLRNGSPVKDRALLMTVILSDAINLGLTKMAAACPGTTFSKLDTTRAWYVRDETYSKALAELVNYQHGLPFATHWGTGNTSSSDGQFYPVGGIAEHVGQVNLRYGSRPGVTLYTHISGRYAPYHVKPIVSTMRDATYVLDGLLYHESELRIDEHYTDTHGFTDHIFALCHTLGFRFAPRIRDLREKRLYVPDDAKHYPALKHFLGDKPINTKIILAQWPEYLRLATSIKQGIVTASLMLRKLASYPRQNGLAHALRELGRIERTLFLIDWLLDPALRQRVTAGLNKGEARNSLARAVCFNRLGKLHDRTYELQRHRASGLNLVVAAIMLWNTVYLERAVPALRAHRGAFDETLLKHVAPIHWGHIILIGDYLWRQNKRVEKGGFRPLRPSRPPA